MSQLNVGLVGFGLAGRTLHAPLIAASGMRIAAVVTRQVDAVLASFPDAQVKSSIEALLEVRELDLVVIVSPNRWHYSQALLALEAGKHVVVDKPLAISAAEGAALGAAAERARRKLGVFHNRRWDSDFLTLQTLLAAGTLGEPQLFRARWDRYRPEVVVRWRERKEAGAGVLFDLGSHLIDQALCLFGEPEWVQADIFTQRPGASVDDGFELQMGRGTLRMALGASSLAADHGFRYQLNGTLASFRKSGLDPQEAQLKAGLSPTDRQFGLEPQTQWGRLTVGATARTERVEPQRGVWLKFYRQMRLAMESDAPVPVTAMEACKVLRIIEAARQSATERRVIELLPD